MKTIYSCRSCGHALTSTLIDLGKTPIANDMVALDKVNTKDPLYPLHVYICSTCWLAQLPAYKGGNELFTDTYTYFSSFSPSWLMHVKVYVDKMKKLLKLGKKSLVVELASNDGYLLQYVKEYGIPHIGVEPCKSVADVAVKGIPTIQEFFGVELAKKMVKQYGKANLIVGNNVFAHVPDINDFMAGAAILLKDNGTITYEFQYLPTLIKKCEFDTIYHEHYSYYSLIALMNIAKRHKLTIWNLEMLPTHGGSIRVYFAHKHNTKFKKQPIVTATLKNEKQLGVDTLVYYRYFGRKVKNVKTKLQTLLKNMKAEGKTVAAYGAPAKGNTLLNYCEITKKDITFTVDKNPYKQNKLLPGTHIPVLSPKAIREKQPDCVLILPWNLQNEIMEENAFVHDYGGKFIIPIPTPHVI